MLHGVVVQSPAGVRRWALVLVMLTVLIPFRLDARQTAVAVEEPATSSKRPWRGMLAPSTGVARPASPVPVARMPASAISSRRSEQAQGPAPAAPTADLEAAQRARAAELEARARHTQEGLIKIQTELAVARLKREKQMESVKSTHPDAVALERKIKELVSQVEEAQRAYRSELASRQQQQETQSQLRVRQMAWSAAGISEIIDMQRELERALNIIMREQQQLVEMQRRLAERLAESAALRARIEAATAELQRSGGDTPQAAPRK